LVFVKKKVTLHSHLLQFFQVFLQPMEYNTLNNTLAFPEYGRNIQKLIEYAISIEDETERNNVAKAIIDIMGNLNPHLRDISDFTHKLWDHLAIMSDFKLQFNSPYPTPVKEELFKKPNRIPYKNGEVKYKHFGRTIEELIRLAVEMEDEDRKNALIKIITNHMKKSYHLWSKDTVADEVIFDALRELSRSKLIVDKDLVLSDTREPISKTKRIRKPFKRK